MESVTLISWLLDNWQIIFLGGYKYLNDFKKELINIGKRIGEHHDRLTEIEIREKIKKEYGIKT